MRKAKTLIRLGFVTRRLISIFKDETSSKPHKFVVEKTSVFAKVDETIPYLSHICLMDFPTLTNSVNPFLI